MQRAKYSPRNSPVSLAFTQSVGEPKKARFRVIKANRRSEDSYRGAITTTTKMYAFGMAVNAEVGRSEKAHIQNGALDAIWNEIKKGFYCKAINACGRNIQRSNERAQSYSDCRQIPQEDLKMAERFEISSWVYLRSAPYQHHFYVAKNIFCPQFSALANGASHG